MKKVVVIMMCVLLILALGLAAFLGIGIARGFTGFNWSFGGIVEPELANRQTFAAGDITGVDIAYSSESITILYSTTNEIVLEEYMSRWDDDMLATTSTSGGTLTIRAGRRGWENMWSAKIKLFLPSSWEGALTVASSSGSIRSEENLTLASLSATATSGSVRFADVNAQGVVSLEASSGSVSASNITADGTVTLRTTSGSIRTDDVVGSSVELKASSGSVRCGSITGETIVASGNSGGIQLESVNGAFDVTSTSGSVTLGGGSGYGRAEASSGSVRVTLDELLGDLSLRSTSGSVRLSLPRDSAFEFSASTSSGSIRTDFNDQLSFNERRNDASGSVGANPEYKVELRASSGSVEVNLD